MMGETTSFRNTYIGILNAEAAYILVLDLPSEYPLDSNVSLNHPPIQ